MTYDADTKWDLTNYLSAATISIEKDDEIMATASYSHGGGFGLTKYKGTKSKIDPLIEELLENN